YVMFEAHAGGADEPIVGAQLADGVVRDPRDLVAQPNVAIACHEVFAVRPQGGAVHSVFADHALARFLQSGGDGSAHPRVGNGLVDVGVAVEVAEIGRGGVAGVVDEEFPLHVRAEIVPGGQVRDVGDGPLKRVFVDG